MQVGGSGGTGRAHGPVLVVSGWAGWIRKETDIARSGYFTSLCHDIHLLNIRCWGVAEDPLFQQSIVKASKNTLDYLKSLGERIRIERLLVKWTTIDLAKRAGLPRTTIDRIEAGDPDVGIGAYITVFVLIDEVDRVVGSTAFYFDRPRNPYDMIEPPWLKHELDK